MLDQFKIERSIHFNHVMGKIIAEMSSLKLDDCDIQLKVVIFYDAIQGIRYKTPEHEHPFYEIGWMVSGNMTYQVDEKKIVNTTENAQIVIIPAGNLHQRYSDNNKLSIMRAIEVSINPLNQRGETFIIQLNDTLHSIGYRIAPTDAQLAKLNNLENRIKTLNRFSSKIIQFEIFSFLLELLQEVLSHAPVESNALPKGRYSQQDIANYIKIRIEDLINRPFNISVLTNYFGLSARQLNRIFVKEMQISIGQYAIKRRLFHAERLLANQSNTASDVANALGFNNTSYFFTFFKKHKQISPGTYQKLSQSKRCPVFK